jgi:hypothetical protein
MIEAPAADSYLYGIVLADGQEPSTAEGAQAGRLHTIDWGRVAAVVSDIAEIDLLGTPEDLRAHVAVLDGIAESQPVLPLAFGTLIPGETDIAAQILAPREADYVEALEQLAGHCQMTVRVSYDRDSVLREIILGDPEAAELRGMIIGTSEDETRNERIRLGEIVVTTMESWKTQEAPAILEQIEPLAAHMAERENKQAEDLAEVAVLLPREAVTEFDATIEGLAEANRDRLRFRLVGPQAPYDFVPQM